MRLRKGRRKRPDRTSVDSLTRRQRYGRFFHHRVPLTAAERRKAAHLIDLASENIANNILSEMGQPTYAMVCVPTRTHTTELRNLLHQNLGRTTAPDILYAETRRKIAAFLEERRININLTKELCTVDAGSLSDFRRRLLDENFA